MLNGIILKWIPGTRQIVFYIKYHLSNLMAFYTFHSVTVVTVDYQIISYQIIHFAKCCMFRYFVQYIVDCQNKTKCCTVCSYVPFGHDVMLTDVNGMLTHDCSFESAKFITRRRALYIGTSS